ncbi:peroxidasin-like protein [Tribolium madens]|uniref:peroxidasin-like protein n=1 Tax=Tribolium madens TaxID=41895 RepID=UPI001CF7466D|nr:peroxidasin-like protein [Tribolium madens]XP_044254312.1 peroxidasin-like protein [Tribolium madens]XP_044254314.1 peroxidasin-like protein [Tribolium madens]XP_044254315.1 peroxidasin-like protein [Tribolium madens]XP_044254316.1 peroxidasin-like protein [Tribolium madens]
MIPPTHTMPSLNLHLAIIIGFCTQMIVADCPRLCECKWKSGKESVSCPNANLSSIPLHLEAGTQVLDVSKNNLITLKHDEFSKAGLLNLQKVYLSQCRLKNLERYAFRKLINLVELDLSHNFLSSVPSHTFDSIPELRELKLNDNPIQRILNDAFINVPQLIRLELSECRISTIELQAFHGLESSLEWLKLDYNKLTEVLSSSFTILENLHGLELAGNPWNCSCPLRPLREWMLQKNVPFGIPPICQSPKRLRSKTWDKLDLDEFACIPEIFAYESKTRGVEGKNVTMTCRITGIPEPSVRWLLKNKVIANLSGSSYSNGKKLYMVHLSNNSSDLTIFSADLQDAGVYVCAAENKAGRAEASVTLAVIRKPPETAFNNKILIASVITGIALVLASCLIALCVYSVRKKQMLTWRTRECRREDNYEKIEMNHKVSGNSNGGTVQAEIAVVATKKNGEYRVVPVADNEEVEEEEESNVEAAAKRIWQESAVEKRWNSPEHLLDPEDLHIPRRTLQEARDDIRKGFNSTSGIYSGYEQPSTSLSQSVAPHLLRRQISGGHATTYNSELSSLMEDEGDKKYPDLIENSSYKFGNKANSVGGSVADITELFCTLPRKRTLIQSSRYKSSDSQSPLLPESRYGSSGGDSSCGSQESGLRRLSDCPKYSAVNLNKNRVNKISNSYLNLTREEDLTSTPLLDVTGLESRVGFSPTSVTPNANSYDYHAAQLERFLEEYRSLQKQLTKMKETCDNLCQDHLQAGSPAVTPSTSNDDVLRNNPVSPNSNQSLEDSIDFRNFESELTKYLLAKSSPSPKTFTNNSGVFNN